MVSVRRPTPRGGGTSRLMVYVRYAVAGGMLVFLLNLLRGGIGGDQTIIIKGAHTHSILNLNVDATGGTRRTPPDFASERLQRRKHEEEKEKHHHDLKDDLKQQQGRVDEEREKHLEKMQEQHHDEEEDHAEVRGHQTTHKKSEEEEEEDVEDNGAAEGRISGDNSNEDAGNDNDGQQKIQYVSPNGDVLEKPEGTGPTNLGFVMDFVHERGHPKFRSTSTADKIETSRQNHAQIVATALSESNVQPCEYFEEEDGATTTTTTPRLLQRKVCRDPERPLLVYNGASFPRTWCGVSIPPKSAARMDDHNNGDCKEPVHLFERDFPPVNGQGMSPIVLHSQEDSSALQPQNLEEVPDCSIPCQAEKDMTGIARFIQGTDWTIFHSDQDPNSNGNIVVGLSKYKHDEYYSTTYFKSEVPLSPIDLEKHNLRNAHPPVDFDSVLDKGVYIVNENCGGTGSRRQRWKEVLENQYHVDSLGQCGHTKDLEPGQSLETMEDRLEIMKHYKFNLGFEISTHKDWLTPLSYEAFLSGAVPIILGASNAKMHLPRQGAIFASDFNSWDKLVVFVNSVAQNKTLWNSYHAWRTDEAILAAFERKYQFTKTNPTCRLCSWAYAKMFGLGWDHELQQVQETHIPRKLCVDEDSGLIVKPFREEWSVGKSSSVGAPGGAEGSCKSVTTANEKELNQDGWKIVKSVVQHDSIIDITIHDIDMGSNADETMTLTFEYKDVNNTEGAFFANSHSLIETERGMLMSSATIQDHKTKITVLANWETMVWSPSQGIIQIIIHSKASPQMHKDEQKRIRVISEDMGSLHDKMTEYFPSSFSKRMIQDFIDPLEVFYLDS